MAVGIGIGVAVGITIGGIVGMMIGAGVDSALWLPLAIAAPMPIAAAPAAGAITDDGMAALEAAALVPIDAVNGVAAVASVVRPVPANACETAAAPPAAVTTPERLMNSDSPLVSANVCVPTVTTTSPLAHAKHDTTSPFGPLA